MSIYSGLTQGTTPHAISGSEIQFVRFCGIPLGLTNVVYC